MNWFEKLIAERKDLIPDVEPDKTENSNIIAPIDPTEAQRLIDEYREKYDFDIDNIPSRKIQKLKLHKSLLHSGGDEVLQIYYAYEGEQYQNTKQIQATIWLYIKEKRFDFTVEYDSMFRGYGTAIYKAAPLILKKLNYNPDEWTICAAHRPEGKSDFIKHIEEKGER